MGNALDRPVTEKTTRRSLQTGRSLPLDGTGSSNRNIVWGASMVQGWRPYMEDRFLCECIESVSVVDGNDDSNVNDDDGVKPTTTTTTTIPIPSHHLMCIMDGHGGAEAVDIVQEHFRRVLCQQPSFLAYARSIAIQGGDDCNDGARNSNKKKAKKKSTKANRRRQQQQKTAQASEKALQQLRQAMEDSFVAMDRMILQNFIAQGFVKPQPPTEKDEDADDWDVAIIDEQKHDNDDDATPTPEQPQCPGTTMVAVLITPHHIICANAGDSRAVLRADTVLSLSVDHKPTDEIERQRIEAAGGEVNFGRVDGELAMSRALGDFELKGYPFDYHRDASLDDCQRRHIATKLKVSPVPTIEQWQRGTERVVVVASDGVWDVMSNEQCLDLVQQLHEEGESDPGLVAEELLDVCLKKGTRDNCAAIVIRFGPETVGNGGGVRKRRSGRQ